MLREEEVRLLTGERVNASGDRMEFRLTAVIHLDVDRAEILYHAILPEVRDIPSRRVSADLSVEDGKLILSISAADLVALRAALNSFLRFISSTLQTLEAVSRLG